MRLQDLLGVLPLATLLLVSCADETCLDCREPVECDGGETRPCECDSGVASVQSCRPDGTFDACECGAESRDVGPDGDGGSCVTAPPIRYGDPCCDPDASINVDECNYCVCNPVDGAETGYEWQCTASACDTDGG
jgi:hypothetical protein